MQFIGGEPTLRSDLGEMLEHARNVGIRDVEVFTNATGMSEALKACIIENNVRIATSLYGSDSSTHDAKTRLQGSFNKTVGTIRELLAQGVEVRVGVIGVESCDRVDDFLHSIGVTNAGFDQIRSIGRGSDLADGSLDDDSNLCGNCWKGSLCVLPNGNVIPCTMARTEVIGSVLEESLKAITESDRLLHFRSRIKKKFGFVLPSREGNSGPCSPNSCAPLGPVDVPQCSPRSGCYPSGSRV